jgi:predicted permease
MGIPIVAGRGFNSADTETSPKVAVINQTLAKQYFSDTDPIEKQFRGYSFISEVPFQIVGISADTRYDSLRKDPPATYYVLYSQLPRTGGQMTYEVRTHVPPDSLVPSVRQTVQSIDKNIPLMGVRTQANQIHDTIQQEWLFASITASFGILALLLTCIGVYGVMSYSVARRTREIGIRLALGAQTRGILGMILDEALRVTLAGVVVGLGVAFLLSGLVRAMLFGLEPNDPIAMASAALLLMVISFLAAFVPALRASRMKPIEALRSE